MENQTSMPGVIIPQQTVAQSEQNKKQRRGRTLKQLPVYRAAKNLVYLAMVILRDSPQWTRRFSDSLVSESLSLLTVIGYASYTRDNDSRIDFINQALVLVTGIDSYIDILATLGLAPSKRRKPRHRKDSDNKPLSCPDVTGVVAINRETTDKFHAVIRSITAQLVAWRSSITESPQNGTGCVPIQQSIINNSQSV